MLRVSSAQCFYCLKSNSGDIHPLGYKPIEHTVKQISRWPGWSQETHGVDVDVSGVIIPIVVSAIVCQFFSISNCLFKTQCLIPRDSKIGGEFDEFSIISNSPFIFFHSKEYSSHRPVKVVVCRVYSRHGRVDSRRTPDSHSFKKHKHTHTHTEKEREFIILLQCII